MELRYATACGREIVSKLWVRYKISILADV